MPSRLQKWVEGKLEIAEKLENGEAGGGYAEACLVVSAIISGVSSDLWPGKRIDRKRFVELWTRFSPEGLDANLVSIPSLIQTLEDEGQLEISKILRDTNSEAFGGFDSLVITGRQVDLSIDEVLRLCPSLDLKKVREYTYGCLFYERVRSSFTHEYRIGANASSHPMARPGSGVSYTNLSRNPHSDTGDDAESGPLAERWEVVREIHFEMDWLYRLVRGITLNVQLDWEKQPLPHPQPWWVSGE